MPVATERTALKNSHQWCCCSLGRMVAQYVRKKTQKKPKTNKKQQKETTKTKKHPKTKPTNIKKPTKTKCSNSLLNCELTGLGYWRADAWAQGNLKPDNSSTAQSIAVNIQLKCKQIPQAITLCSEVKSRCYNRGFLAQCAVQTQGSHFTCLTIQIKVRYNRQ